MKCRGMKDTKVHYTTRSMIVFRNLQRAQAPRVNYCIYIPVQRRMASYQSLPRPNVPSNTENDYEQIILPNGMKVTLISIPNAEKSSAALNIKVGANNDTLSGLAHFTEHAVFLGSKKYPEENHFKKLLAKNAGRSNGSTSMELTSFHFEVNHGAFEDVLDVWTQFFIAPLMRDDAIEREIQAVTAEDSKNRINDSRRTLQTLKSLIVDNEVYKNFSTGNVETLAFGNASEYAPELAAIMKEFHRLYYKPDSMQLSLCGPQPIDELRSYAIEYFSLISPIKIENVAEGSVNGVSALQKYDHVHIPMLPLLSEDSVHVTAEARYEQLVTTKSPGYPFKPEVLGNLVQLRPINQARDLTLLFGMPSVHDSYKASPTTLIGYIIRHQGPGSLFAALQDLGWATSVGSGKRSHTQNFCLFEISISLSPEGYKHYNDVIKLVYSHIEYLFGDSSDANAVGTVSDAELIRTWNENKSINKIGFSFQERTPPYALSKYCCSQMAYYPMEDIFTEAWIMDDIDVAVVRRYSKYLAPSRAVGILRCHADMKEWIPQDDPNCITIEAANELLSTYESKTSDVGDVMRPNRVELNYGIPYYIAPHSILSQKCEYKSLQDAIHALELQDKSSMSTKIKNIVSAFPLRNPYVSHDLQLPSASNGEKVTQSSPPTKVWHTDEKVIIHNYLDTYGKVAELPLTNHYEYSLAREQVWHSYDQAFRQPRSSISVKIRSHAGSEYHPIHSLITNLYNQIVKQKLYPANLAGLSYSVSMGTRGMSFSVSGYSPKLPQLLKDIIRDFTSLTWWNTNLETSMVEILRDRKLRSLRSWITDRPDSQASMLLSYLMSESDCTLIEEDIEAAENITIDSVKTCLEKFVVNTHQHITYYHGDESMSGAVTGQLHKDIAGIFEKKVPSVPIDNLIEKQANSGWGILDKPDRAKILPQGKHVVLALDCPNKDDINSALVTHFQCGGPDSTQNPKHRAIITILRRLLHEPMFNALRTNKQLGYVVSMSNDSYGSFKNGQGKYGFTATILSNRFNPLEMQNELFDFLHNHRQFICKELSNDELKSRVDAAILSIRDPPTRYTQEANSFLYSILNDIPFEYDELVIDELQNITLDDIRYSYCKWILGEEYTDSSEISGNIERGSCSFGRRSVSVQLWGGEHKGEPAKAKDRGDTLGASAGCALFNHDDLHAFKASLPYFNAEILKFKI